LGGGCGWWGGGFFFFFGFGGVGVFWVFLFFFFFFWFWVSFFPSPKAPASALPAFLHRFHNLEKTARPNPPFKPFFPNGSHFLTLAPDPLLFLKVYFPLFFLFTIFIQCSPCFLSCIVLPHPSTPAFFSLIRLFVRQSPC